MTDTPHHAQGALKGAKGAIVVRWGALGDMVMTTPILRALSERHGAPCIVVGLGGWVPALFKYLPFVGAVHTIKSRKAPYWMSPDQWELVRILKTYKDHPVYTLAGDERSVALIKRAGLTITAGGHTAGFKSNEHQVDNHARIAGFDAHNYNRKTALLINDSDKNNCLEWVKKRFPDTPVDKIVLLQAGNKKTMSWRKRSNDVKSWSVDNWVSVIRHVLKHDPAIKVALTGAPSERDMTNAIVQAVADHRVTSIAGETPLRQLLSLLSLAHSMISVDTGPAHAAAAVGCPLVVLFGATDPRVNGPIATTAQVKIITGPPDAPILDGEAGWSSQHSMSAINPTQVMDAWDTIRTPPATNY